MRVRTLAILVVSVLVHFVTLVQAEPPAARNFTAHLSGDQQVPPVTTSATGQAVFKLNPSESSLSYILIAANIDNVVQAHIHIGPQGGSGPPVAFLFGAVPPGGGRVDGVLATGSIESADLVGPLAGQDLSVLIQAIRTGGAYVNVHTNDGIGPTNEGPGDFPAGEIRGQIRSAGPQ